MHLLEISTFKDKGMSFFLKRTTKYNENYYP